MLKKLQIVGVMGSGKDKMSELAEPLGEALARLPVHLLTGGGYGVMQSVAKGFTSVVEREGLSIGCIPMRLDGANQYQTASKSYPNPYIELPLYTPLDVYKPSAPDAISRNYVNILTSNLVIALPGGNGTKQEVELAQRFNKATLLYGPEEGFQFDTAGLSRTTDLAEVARWVKKSIPSHIPAFTA